MSRQIQKKPTLSLSPKEVSERGTKQGKILFTSYQEKECALLIQNDRLTAAQFLSGERSKVGGIYVGQVKNVASNINACFVEIADKELCFLPLKKTSEPYLLNRTYDGRLVAGDILLVQVDRDAQKTKQASLTTQISLSNEYFVLSMGNQKVNCSSKLWKAQREKVKKEVWGLFSERGIFQNGFLVQDWNMLLSPACIQGLLAAGVQTEHVPLPSTGCIIRTQAAEEAPQNLLDRFYALAEQYVNLLHTARHKNCFSCLKEPPCAVETALCSLASAQEYEEIVTDSEYMFGEVEKYCGAQEHPKPVRFYSDDLLSLSKLYSIEKKMSMALDRRVWLKSGGYIVIDATEALTVIDVNSGKYETGKGTEEAALHVNQEAAEEIALQLRLRNISGIIIVDFINMAQDSSKNQVLSLLKRLTDKDSIKTTVVDLTPLGLVEITRKKVSKSLWEQYNELQKMLV